MTDRTIRIQPVEPETPKLSQMLIKLAATLAGIGLLGGLFVMLAAGTVHDLYPSVPPVGYWQSVSLILGLQVVGGAVRPRPWKWAAR